MGRAPPRSRGTAHPRPSPNHGRRWLRGGTSSPARRRGAAPPAARESDAAVPAPGVSGSESQARDRTGSACEQGEKGSRHPRSLATRSNPANRTPASTSTTSHDAPVAAAAPSARPRTTAAAATRQWRTGCGVNTLRWAAAAGTKIPRGRLRLDRGFGSAMTFRRAAGGSRSRAPGPR